MYFLPIYVLWYIYVQILRKVFIHTSKVFFHGWKYFFTVESIFSVFTSIFSYFESIFLWLKVFLWFWWHFLFLRVFFLFLAQVEYFCTWKTIALHTYTPPVIRTLHRFVIWTKLSMTENFMAEKNSKLKILSTVKNTFTVSINLKSSL